MTDASGLLMVALVLCVARAVHADEGLVARYTFDEGSGAVAEDVTGNGNDGKIHGARYVENGTGYCLSLDGLDDYVNCGSGPSLNMTDAVTLEAWVRPEGDPKGEPAIMGKFFTSYLMTYYGNAGCYFYITEGRNNLRVGMLPGSWHHVAATFDGSQMKVYVEGKLKGTRAIRIDGIAESTYDFLIGCALGDPRTDRGTAHPRTAYFKGMIDEVRVYNRAIAASEVWEHFRGGIKKLGLLGEYRPVATGPSIGGGRLTVKAGKGGRVEVRADDNSCIVETTYSYPGDKIGWNVVGADSGGSEAGWSVKVSKADETALVVEARGGSYSLRRTVRLDGDRVEFADTLTNVSDGPVGLLVWNNVDTPTAFLETHSPGEKAFGENPSVFLAGEKGNLAVMLEDNVSRMRYDAVLGVPANRARIRISDLAIDVGKSLTLRWSLYSLDNKTNYLTFINRTRRDWKSNFAVDGPFAYFHPAAPSSSGWWLPWKDPEQLKAYLARKRLGVVAFLPFLDYDPGYFHDVPSRGEYKKIMLEIIAALKTADPDIKCIGSIECDWVTIDPKKIEGGEKLPYCEPGKPSGEVALTAEQTRVIDESDLPWKDSAKRNAEGNLTLELYRRGGKDKQGKAQTALAVYPIVGNHQYDFLLDQVKFLLDDVGFDGFYIDQFSMVNSTIRTYGKWDGVSAEIDADTGKIKRKYFDANLAGISARVNLCQYALDRGKIVVANTYATSREEQALPVNRVSEVWNAFDPMATPDGAKPSLVPLLLRGSLASPIALGVQGRPKEKDTARRTIKAVVGYLRHGLLYYHYHIGDIPQTGEGSGEYGPINHMFPITPIELGEGFLIGKERIVTAVSMNHLWSKEGKPAARFFDLTGRAVESGDRARIVPENGQWRIRLKVKDWAEIAIVE